MSIDTPSPQSPPPPPPPEHLTDPRILSTSVAPIYTDLVTTWLHHEPRKGTRALILNAFASGHSPAIQDLWQDFMVLAPDHHKDPVKRIRREYVEAIAFDLYTLARSMAKTTEEDLQFIEDIDPFSQEAQKVDYPLMGYVAIHEVAFYRQRMKWDAFGRALELYEAPTVGFPKKSGYKASKKVIRITLNWKRRHGFPLVPDYYLSDLRLCSILF